MAWVTVDYLGNKDPLLPKFWIEPSLKSHAALNYLSLRDLVIQKTSYAEGFVLPPFKIDHLIFRIITPSNLIFPFTF